MTFTIGWKAGLAAAVLLIALVVGIVLTIKWANDRDEVDWERKQLVEQLEAENGDLKKKLAEAHAQSESIRVAREADKVASDKALAEFKRLQAIPAPTPEQREQTCVACLAAVRLLEESLRLANVEVLALRRELDFAYASIEVSERLFETQSLRLRASQKKAKKAKRRGIWTSVGAGVAGGLAGAGLGRIGCT